MNRMFIAGNVALTATPATIAAISAASKIAPGALAFYNVETGAVIKDTASVGSPKEVVMMLGGTDYSKQIQFDVKGFKYNKVTDATNTLTTIKVSGAALVVGTEYTLIFTNPDAVQGQQYRRQVSVLVTAADTYATIGAKVVSVLSKSFPITLSASDATSMTFTTSEPTVDFNIKGADGFTGATVAKTSTSRIALGSKEGLKLLWEKNRGGEGINSTDPNGIQLWTDPTFTGTAVVYALEFTKARTFTSVGENNVRNKVYLVVPTGATCIAALDQVLTGLAALA